MSRFYGEMQGNKGGTSRMGSADSGFTSHVRGWQVGAKVYMHADGEEDVCTISATSGSASGRRPVELGTLRAGMDGLLIFTPSEGFADAAGIKRDTVAL